MEQVRTVLVHLDASLRLCLRVGVAADVVAAFDNEHALTQLIGGPLSNGQTEETRTDHDEVVGVVLDVL